MNNYEYNNGRPDLNVPQPKSDFNPVKTIMWGIVGWDIAALLIYMFNADRSTRSGRLQYRIAWSVVWFALAWVGLFVYWMVTAPDYAIT